MLFLFFYLESLRFSFIYPKLILSIWLNKAIDSATYTVTHLFPMLFCKGYSLHYHRIIKKSNRRLYRVDILYFQLIQHDCSCCCLLILRNCKRAAVKSKLTINFLNKLWKNPAFVVVWVRYWIIWTIKKGIFSPGVTVKVKIHEDTIFSMHLCCKIFDMQNLRIKLLFCVQELSI